MRIIVAGVISLSPFAPGFAWNWLQLAVGLRKLGHDVYYVEDVEPAWCVDSTGRQCPLEASINRSLFQSTMEYFGFQERACQIYDRGKASFGLPLATLEQAARDTDLVLNIAGHLKTASILERAERRAYLDQDPVYTQLWAASYGKDLNFASHHVFVTVGLNIGTLCSPIPDCGLEWRPMLPAVLPEYWEAAVKPACVPFTTVASWSGFGDLCYRGAHYRSKREEFVRFASLPRLVPQTFELALRRHREDDPAVALLRSNSWEITDATGISDLVSYQRYIARSRAELCIAKNAYVQGRSGWFSDRSAHYLVSGKPVLAQATGFEQHLPTGRGLLAFSTLEEAAAGIETINRDYETHCRAARAFAEEYLDYRRVLPALLDICDA
jgi:hypothetical protein